MKRQFQKAPLRPVIVSYLLVCGATTFLGALTATRPRFSGSTSTLMNMSPEERQRLFTNLDAVERVAVTFYRLLLGSIVAAVVAAVALAIAWRPWGAGNQGEWLYFSLAVLLLLGWTVGQFVRLDRRARNRRPQGTFDSSTADGVRTWTFRLGPAAAEAQRNPTASGDDIQCGFSRSVEIPLASLPESVLPGEDTLMCLERELKRGVPIDEACSLVQPAFADWNERERKAYRLYVASLMNQPHSLDSMD